MLTKDQLLHIAPLARQVDVFAPFLTEGMAQYEINTPNRIRAYLSQILHESGQFKYTREIWGPTPDQLGYEGREDLGNTEPGDGRKFKGRGLIQITGRVNYQEISDAMGIDFVAHPEMLEWPEYAAKSAAWWWKKHGLNELADTLTGVNSRIEGLVFQKITRRINGGLNGYADRWSFYLKTIAVIK
jgi:putative chitinase